MVIPASLVPLSSIQRRTRDDLIGRGPGPEFPDDLRDRLVERIERNLPSLDPLEPLRLTKGRLTDLGRCEGLFAAGLAGEGEPFAHSLASASGSLTHKSIELDVANERGSDARSVIERAAERLVEDDAGFRAFWRALDPIDRGEILGRAAATLVLFREVFPPIPRGWSPIPEQLFRANMAGGGLKLVARPDLVLGRPSRLHPARASRLVIDLKSGEPRPEHVEDLRFYALVVLLWSGRPPYRIATLFLESCTWQAEDVTLEVLEHAADRVAAAAGSAAALGLREPALTPGPYCAWCPRTETCPVSAARS